MVERTPVLIVGGGIAGLSASLMLGRLGVESILIERHPGTSRLPKAHIVNLRTMEIFAAFGASDDIYEIGSPLEFMSRVAWYTSFEGPTPLHGREIAHRDSWGGGASSAQYVAASKYRTTNLAQLELEPLIREHAERAEGSRLRFGHELVSLREERDGVLAVVRDLDRDETYEVRAAYVIAADGGRAVGPMLGVTLEGERDLVDMVSSHIVTDLAGKNPDPRVCIFWMINPDRGGSVGSGVFIKMGGSAWGAKSDHWVFSFARPPEDDGPIDPDDIAERVRESAGIPDLEVEVRSTSPWRIESVVADAFSVGRVFFAGDAAHRHPPTGGLGLNTAVQDVHNLAWKLALVLRGAAGEDLLASYEAERRPVAQRNAAQSLSSFFEHSNIDRSFGYEPGVSPEEGWKALARLFDEGVNADALDEAVHGKRREFSAVDLEIGYAYREGAIISDRPAPGEEPSDPALFDVAAAPGTRMPHTWVGSGARQVSTYELVDPRAFTLFAGPEGRAWIEAADDLALPDGFVLDTVQIGGRHGWDEPSGQWLERAGIAPDGAILVRPDHYVAWRAATSSPDPRRDLHGALDALHIRVAAQPAIA